MGITIVFAELNKKDSAVMQFILIAYDGLDEDAKKRRLLAREDHLIPIKNWRHLTN